MGMERALDGVGSGICRSVDRAGTYKLAKMGGLAVSLVILCGLSKRNAFTPDMSIFTRSSSMSDSTSAKDRGPFIQHETMNVLRCSQ